MSDQLTGDPVQQRSTSVRPGWAPVVRQALVVVVLFAVVGAVAGWIWHEVWTPPTGTVTQGVWYTDEAGLRDQFSGTALYVVVAIVAGLLAGLVSALLLSRAELATLLAVSVGSALAAWLMWTLGVHLGPADPQAIARTAADDTRLPGALAVGGLTPFLALPGSALAALLAVFLVVQKPPVNHG